MSYATLDSLRESLAGASPTYSPEYKAKQLHDLPKAENVNREKFILKHCADKQVLEFGASGKLHEAIVAVAKLAIGVDLVGSHGPGCVLHENGKGETVGTGHVHGQDLDDTERVIRVFPFTEGDKPDVIICGEILEHLGNPLSFLQRLHESYAGVPTIITVPNAYNAGSLKWLAQGIENVNADHVAWYSPKTISVLLTRAGYTVGGLFYYNGQGPTSEGLVVVTE